MLKGGTGDELPNSKTVKSGDDFTYPSVCTSELSRTPEDFLVTLFNSLDSNEIRYCVLHSWEELPEKLSSDLDIAVHPGDVRKLPFVFRFLREKGYTAVQVLNYFVNAYYFVFFWLEGPVMTSVAVDIIFEHRRGGLIVPSGESLVTGRRRQGVFWIPAPESEFMYLLAKKTWKGMAPPRQVSRLRILVEQLGQPIAERLSRQLFLDKFKAHVVEACATGRIDALLPEVKGLTWRTSFLRSPWKFAAYVISDGVRRVRRWLQPTGFFVAVMGLDGTGKSTIIKHVVRAVGPAFRRHRLFHWRPNLLWRRKAATETNRPHSRPEDGSLWSVTKIFAYVLDYWLGYWLAIRPLLARSGLVIFDRYFDDLLIDSKRYRYGGPLWVARFLRFLIPRPDLILILDAPAEVVLSRKQEVAPEEVQRQEHLYREYQNRLANRQIIDATAPIEQVTAESSRVILGCLARRFERRHGRWLAQAKVFEPDAGNA